MSLACFWQLDAIYITLSSGGAHSGYNPMLHKNRCSLWCNIVKIICRMHRHAGLLHHEDHFMCSWTETTLATVKTDARKHRYLQQIKLCVFDYLPPHSLLWVSSNRDIFSRFACAAHPPLPLISLGVTLRFWVVLTTEDTSLPLLLFEKFLLLQAYCTFVGGIGTPSPPSSPHPQQNMQA